jgi:hypothetical protein
MNNKLIRRILRISTLSSGRIVSSCLVAAEFEFVFSSRDRVAIGSLSYSNFFRFVNLHDLAFMQRKRYRSEAGAADGMHNSGDQLHF